VINEPSVVAVNQKTGQVVAVGAEAKAMLGRTPAHIVAGTASRRRVISASKSLRNLFHIGKQSAAGF